MSQTKAAADVAGTPGAYLTMPEDRRQAARAVVATMSESVRRHAMTLPLTADIDDFRRDLTAAAPATGSTWG